jgi:undecaprenyl-diphosphatase
VTPAEVGEVDAPEAVFDQGAVVPTDPARDPSSLRRARRRALLLSAGLLAVAAAMTIVVAVDPHHPWFQGVDDAWDRLMAAHRSPVATAAALTLSFIGGALVTWPLRALALALLLRRRRFTQAAAFTVATVVAELCIGPVKSLLDRPRPDDILVATHSASFPSGHAIAAGVTAFGLVVAFLPRGRRRIHWVGFAAAFSASMALSRTYLHAHWLTDTVAGVCIGVACALGAEALFESTRTEVAEVRELADAVATQPDAPGDDAQASAS